jgi:hypothetical protein
MRRMDEVLVSMEHAHGVAAVVRTRRGVELAGRMPRMDALVDGDGPAIVGFDGDWTAIGGLLPPGAMGAEVVDDAGARHAAAAANGAWVIVLDQPAHAEHTPIRYFDAAGETVAAPIPGSDRTPVRDAQEPCPACGACDWEQVVPGPQRVLGGGWWQPGAAVACRACGHAEDMGTFYGGRSEGEAQPWPEEEGLREGEAELPPLPELPDPDLGALAQAPFPVYAVPGQPAEVGVRGRDVEGLSMIEIVHAGPPPVTVTTDRDAVPGWSEAGWAAVRRRADLVITVTARDCAPAEITLEPLV